MSASMTVTFARVMNLPYCCILKKETDTPWTVTMLEFRVCLQKRLLEHFATLHPHTEVMQPFVLVTAVLYSVFDRLYGAVACGVVWRVRMLKFKKGGHETFCHNYFC